MYELSFENKYKFNLVNHLALILEYTCNQYNLTKTDINIKICALEILHQVSKIQ